MDDVRRRPAFQDRSDSECARRVRDARELSTGEAIDAVLASVPGGAEVLSCGYQLLVRKHRGAYDVASDLLDVVQTVSSAK